MFCVVLPQNPGVVKSVGFVTSGFNEGQQQQFYTDNDSLQYHLDWVTNGDVRTSTYVLDRHWDKYYIGQVNMRQCQIFSDYKIVRLLSDCEIVSDCETISITNTWVI